MPISPTDFYRVQQLRREGYIIYYDDGEIMSQDSQKLAIVKKTKLLDEVRDAIRTKHYSIKAMVKKMAYVRYCCDS